jgi:SWI/SNF-related matrix-associated actin-dependent regulator of chromatin subfamily A3
MEEKFIELSPDERGLYEIVEGRARVRVNKYLKEGDAMKNYSNILAMILRLRQVCSAYQLNLM